MRENPVRERSYSFALRVVRLYRELLAQKEYVLSKQMVRSGTSIGANVEEALAAQSRPNFIAKMSIARKEAHECTFWLRLVSDSGLAPREVVDPLIEESGALARMLTSIVKTAQERRE